MKKRYEFIIFRDNSTSSSGDCRFELDLPSEMVQDVAYKLHYAFGAGLRLRNEQEGAPYLQVFTTDKTSFDTLVCTVDGNIDRPDFAWDRSYRNNQIWPVPTQVDA